MRMLLTTFCALSLLTAPLFSGALVLQIGNPSSNQEARRPACSSFCLPFTRENDRNGNGGGNRQWLPEDTSAPVG
jgi:hypothetical protein